MNITINGNKKTFTAPLDIEAVLEQENYGDKLVAVARNGSFVPKTDWAATTLMDGDELDIVAPMQGG